MCFCLGSSAVAGEFAYTCEVRHLYQLESDGSLKTYPQSELEKLMKQTSFSVSRMTGALTGNSASLDTSLAKSTRVISGGSKDNRFAAVADFGEFPNGTHTYQLVEIEEFQKGATKPFVLVGVNGIVTGTCR
jgi:hypothetical protein